MKLTIFQDLATEKESEGFRGQTLRSPPWHGGGRHPAEGATLEVDASFKIVVLAKNVASRQVNCFAKEPFLS